LTEEAARRRSFLRHAGTLGAATAFGSPVLSALAGEIGHVTLSFANGERELVAYP
jgi:sulfite dehydrogenase